MSYKLSKTHYLFGLECPRYLWNMVHYPEKIRKMTIAEEYTLAEGIQAGEIAKQLYPNGINIPIEDYSENLLKTNEFLIKNKPLFEAGFEFDNCFARTDILVPNGDGWDIVEVKKGTRVKDKNIHDLSFQKYIFQGNCLKIKNCYLFHLNGDYFRRGELNLQELFVKANVSLEVDAELPFVKERIERIFNFLSSEEIPEPRILSLERIVKSNHDCLLEKCLELPPDNVFCLYGSKKQSYELFQTGIELIRDIPEDFILTDKQGIQRECAITKKPHINKERLNDFLRKLSYPLYFLDFETFLTAIPMFDGIYPYFQVPFQFSLHIVENSSKKPIHYEYLCDRNEDPREEFLLELQKVLGDKGSIVVYNKSFEIYRLKELADHFTEQKKWTDKVIKRIVDLLELFRNFHYYHPKQQGSASIKAVLSAMTDMNYENLEIRDGRTAPGEFLRITCEECNENEKTKVREDLLEYCKLDTLAQVKIIEKLRELVK